MQFQDELRQQVSTERRLSRPSPIYLNEGYEVVVEGEHAAMPGEVTGISSEQILVSLLDSAAIVALPPGKPVTVRFTRPVGGLSRIRGTARRSSVVTRSGQRVIEVTIDIAGGALAEPSRAPGADRQFALPPFHQPVASARCPISGGEPIIFRVTALGRRRLTLAAPANAPALLPGMELSLSVHMPPRELRGLRATVMGVAPGEGAEGVPERRVEVELAEPSATALEAQAGALLLTGAGVSLREAREAGFEIPSVDEWLSFGYLDSQQEMPEVLELRFLAYRSKGKRMHVSSPAEMQDRFDAYSRHLTCRIGGRLVASARMTFNGGDLRRSEYASYGVDLPQWVRAVPFVEVGRVTTHPDYRGSNIVFRLMQELARVAVQSGARYVVGSASDALQLYERVGFKKMGIQYDAHGMKGVEVIYLDVHEIFTRMRGLDFMTWNLVALPIVDKIARRQDVARMLDLGWVERLRLLGHRAVHPVMKKLAERRRPRSPRRPAPQLAPSPQPA